MLNRQQMNKTHAAKDRRPDDRLSILVEQVGYVVSCQGLAPKDRPVQTIDRAGQQSGYLKGRA